MNNNLKKSFISYLCGGTLFVALGVIMIISDKANGVAFTYLALGGISYALACVCKKNMKKK